MKHELSDMQRRAIAAVGVSEEQGLAVHIAGSGLDKLFFELLENGVSTQLAVSCLVSCLATTITRAVADEESKRVILLRAARAIEDIANRFGDISREAEEISRKVTD